ncbi:MAG: O-antigen ligase family protein, partial [Eubacterium sp.]|nr:O-antigen ligase family protein [Eubacterium sp.]
MTNSEDIKISRMWIAPLIIMIAVVPLITIIHVYDCGLEANSWFSSGGKLYDFFLYYKAFAIRAMGIFALFFMIYLMAFYDRSFINKRAILPLISIGLFGVFSLISAIFSKHTYEAFFGGYEQFEGWLVIFAYITCFLLTFGFIRTVKLIRFLLDVLMIGAAIVGILGFFQAIGIDWIQSGWAKYLLTPEIADQTDISKFNIKLNFGKGMSYVTFYNPNYVGSYVALVLPYCVYIIISGEKIWRKITASVTSVLLIITLIASKSLTGVLGVLIAGVVAGILLLPRLKKAKIIAISTSVVLIGAAAAIVILQPSFFSKLFGEGTENYYIESMITTDNNINITTGSGKVITVTADLDRLANTFGDINNTITIKDENGKEINTTSNADMTSLTISEDGVESLRFGESTNDKPIEDGTSNLLYVQDGQNIWNFVPIDDKLMHFNSYKRVADLHNIKKAGFDKKYYFASRRGYIWSRTLPLTTENLFVGVGPDNFVYAFPNDDYVGKKYMGYDNQTITKPHDMYLQIWIQDGLPALIGFLALYIIFIIRAVILCFKKK